MGFLKLLFGALLVGVGGILLGTALGVISGDVWPALLQYWPLLIVAIGVALLAHAIKSIVLGWLSALLVVGGLLLGAWWFTTHQPAGGGDVTTIDLAKPPVDSVTLRLRTLVGRFEIASRGSAARLLRIEALHVPEKMKSAKHWRTAGRAGIFEWPHLPGTGGLPPFGGELRVGLPERQPTRLELKAYLSTGDADLRALRPERSTFNVVGSSVRAFAGEQGDPQRIRVRGFLSNVRLHLPANAPVRVVYSGWFGLRTMPRDFIQHLAGQHREQIFVSEGRGSPILVEIEGPLLRVVIDRAPVKETEQASVPAAGSKRTPALPAPGAAAPAG
jgi:hypothetical protein